MAIYSDIIDKNLLNRFYTNLKANGLPLNEWQANKKYKEGATVIYSGKLYRCNTEHTSSTSIDTTAFTEISGGGNGISEWQAATDYEVNDVVIYNNCIYRCDTAHTSTSTFDATKFTQLTYEQEVDANLIEDIFGGEGV